jgi:hypothetical protein
VGISLPLFISFVFVCLPASELLTINYKLLTLRFCFAQGSRHTAHGFFVLLTAYGGVFAFTSLPVTSTLFLSVIAMSLRRSNLYASFSLLYCILFCPRLKAHGAWLLVDLSLQLYTPRSRPYFNFIKIKIPLDNSSGKC